MPCAHRRGEGGRGAVPGERRARGALSIFVCTLGVFVYNLGVFVYSDYRKLQKLRLNANSRGKDATAWLATIIELKMKQTLAKKLKKQVIRYASQYKLFLGIDSGLDFFRQISP